jgi:hypothetical protein
MKTLSTQRSFKVGVVGENISSRPPFTSADKFLRSSLIKAKLNPRKVGFYDLSDDTNDCVCLLFVGSKAGGLVSTSLSLGQLHLHLLRGADVLVFGTHHPSYVLRRRSLIPAFQDHLRTFAALVDLELGWTHAKAKD